MKHSKEQLASLLQSRLLASGFAGEFHIDKPTRLVNATDNSIYEVLPVAVAIPANPEDVELLIKVSNEDEFRQLYFCARGGGTGTNGQSLTEGIVIDFSKFMRKIIDFNKEQMTVTVEPGIILDDLNRFLEPHGLFFAPHVSTSNRATIGGMISTDAAGKGSLIYGKTADHVLGLKMFLANGQLLDTINPAYNNQDNHSLQEIAAQITNWLSPLQDEINKIFPPLKRPLSGYNIRQCYQDGKFNLNYLLAGAEGTLGVIVAAKLNLVPIPKFKCLFVVHYVNFVNALRDAEFLIQFAPLAIETIDEKVQKSAESLPAWPELAKILNVEDKIYVSNFIEFAAISQEELDVKINKFQYVLDNKTAKYMLIRDKMQMAKLWSIRSLAVGLAAKIPGKRKPVAFVEDAIVPPHYLADFVTDFEKELDQLGLNYAMYGHVDVGCIHVRPALDMQEQHDREQIRPITELVIKLVNKYQGILWGEHGKGYRGEFVPQFFGPILYPVLCKIKALFDPYNRFNPGKLTSPKQQPLQRIELVPMRGQFDQPIAKHTQQQFNDAMICNGNGACFNQEPNNVMCPSYKITGDRVHSPKGRAMLVKEWLRKNATSDVKAQQKAAIEAFNALNGCLGCKGCAGKCPTQVSIPDLRSRFLYSYHNLYKKRKLRDYLLGHIEGILPYASKSRWLLHLIAKSRLSQLVGLNHVPQLSKQSLKSIIKHYHLARYTKVEQIINFKSNPVVIFVDSFTGLVDNQVLQSTIELLNKLGYTPYLTQPLVSGKALIVAGMLDEFKRNCVKLAQLLNPLFVNNIPVVSLENSIALMFRDEVKKFAGPWVEFAGQVLTLAELISNLNHDRQIKLLAAKVDDDSQPKFRLLPHCTEQALAPTEALLWQKIYSDYGLNLTINNLGCCGMAGTYGHLAENKANSLGLFLLNWQKIIVKGDGITNLASGFSCRSQSANLANLDILHPVTALNRLVK